MRSFLPAFAILAAVACSSEPTEELDGGFADGAVLPDAAPGAPDALPVIDSGPGGNQPPSITSAVFDPESRNITGTAVDPDGRIARIEFSVDGGAFTTAAMGTESILISLASLSPGTHAIVIVAYDDDGAASDPVALDVAIIEASIDKAGCAMFGPGGGSVTVSGATLPVYVSARGASAIEVSLDGTFPGTTMVPYSGPEQTIVAELPPGPLDYVPDGTALPSLTLTVRFFEGAYHVDRAITVYSAPRGYYVSATSGDDALAGSPDCPFRTIAPAVRAACMSSGSIFVAAGDYVENVIFPEGCTGVSLLGSLSPDFSRRDVGGCGLADYRAAARPFDTTLTAAAEQDLTSRNNRVTTAFAYTTPDGDVPSGDRWWVNVLLPASTDATTRIGGFHFRAAPGATAGAHVFMDSAPDPGTGVAHPIVEHNFFDLAAENYAGAWVNFRNAGAAARAPAVNAGPVIRCNTFLAGKGGGVLITRGDNSMITGEQRYALDISENLFETVDISGKGILHLGPRLALAGEISRNELRASAASSYGIWAGLTVILDGGAVPVVRSRIADNTFIVSGDAAAAASSSGTFTNRSLGVVIGGPMGPVFPLRGTYFGEMSGNRFEVSGETAWGANVNASSDADDQASIHDNTFETTHAYRGMSDLHATRIENVALWLNRAGNVDGAQPYHVRAENNVFTGPGEEAIHLTNTTNKPAFVSGNRVTNFRYGIRRGTATLTAQAVVTKNLLAGVQYGIFEESNPGATSAGYANNIIAGTFASQPGSSGEKIGIRLAQGASAVIHNTIWMANEAPGMVTAHGIYSHDDPAGSCSPIIVNNLILADGSGELGLREYGALDGSGADFFEVRSNLIFGFRVAYRDGRDSGCVGQAPADYNTGAAIDANATCDDRASGNVAGSDLAMSSLRDLVTDPAMLMFTLPPGSPARGIGWDVNDAATYGPVTDDYTGAPRPDAPSAGAYE